MIYFDSDYMEGAHPKVMDNLLQTNLEHTIGYGKDQYSEEAREAIRKACNAPDALVQFLVGGTQTNATVIDAILHWHEGVVAADSGHISVHESGAIERYGHKVLTLPTENGKIKAEDIDSYITNFYNDDSYEHMVAPGMVYITQPTEYGTLYSLQELTDISQVCHKHQVPLYLDGARLGYALASPESDFTLADIAHLCDVFYIGGTKCGLLFGEAVVATNPSLLKHFTPHIKQHGALYAKGRILGVQFKTLFTKEQESGNDKTGETTSEENEYLYTKICKHANELALRIRDAFITAGYKLAIDSPTNQQFFTIPNELMDNLRANGVSFENWGIRGEKETTVRFVFSWATTDEDVNQLIQLIK